MKSPPWDGLKRFPDGDYIRFWREGEKIYGQLYKKNGRKVRQKFEYLGDNNEANS